MTSKEANIAQARKLISECKKLNTLSSYWRQAHAEQMVLNPHDTPKEGCYCLYCTVERVAHTLSSDPKLKVYK